jgi:hypothetical protein
MVGEPMVTDHMSRQVLTIMRKLSLSEAELRHHTVLELLLQKQEFKQMLNQQAGNLSVWVMHCSFYTALTWAWCAELCEDCM